MGNLSDWKPLLKADPTDWLLEKDNPSVRYSTLTDILEKSKNDTEVKEAKNARAFHLEEVCGAPGGIRTRDLQLSCAK